MKRQFSVNKSNVLKAIFPLVLLIIVHAGCEGCGEKEEQKVAQACIVNGDCSTGYLCQNGICVPRQAGSCTTKADCQAGYICLNGKCVAQSQDTVPPDTTITSSPPNPSNSSAASFSFISTEPGSTFECQMDAGGYSACTSPMTYTGLSEGSHTFYVRAIDQAGNTDSTQATYNWVIDTTPPNTTITSNPANPTNQTTATFAFSSTEAGSSFQCQLDAGGWAACTSPQSYTGLANNSHSFSVRAIDPAGNVDISPASYSWTIDTIPPNTTITSSPPNQSNSSSATFSFSCSEASCTFECQMDSGGYSACTSPKTYTGLSNGSHTFYVRARDAAGNVDGSPAQYTWTIITDTWQSTSTIGAPSARQAHTAVWTGTRMIIWGGLGGGCSDGGRYDPSTDTWQSVSTTNAPFCRYYHSAVWTGTQMIVWGGYGGGYLSTGGRYNSSTDTWQSTSTTGAPSGRMEHTAVWTGTRMIIWGGANASTDFNTGGRYNPSTDTWQSTYTTGAPSGREEHRVVWTGSEMIVWGGGTMTLTFFNTGGRYNPSTDTWQATYTTGAPSARWNHTVVWTGTQMIVWGGEYWNGSSWIYLNTGGRYNPSTDTWQATSTTGAPSGRDGHAAVWTGTEMIVWGGANASSYFNTGGKYNPSTDAWQATSTTSAPSGRAFPTGVWTGTQMIVWGGYNGSPYTNTGGRYIP